MDIEMRFNKIRSVLITH